MPKVLIGLIVVVALFFGGDLFLRNVTEARAEDQLRTALDIRTTPEVTLHGWPFMLRALKGSFNRVSVELDDTRVKGVRLDSVLIELDDVRFALGDLLSGRPDALRSSGGDGTAVMSADGVAQALRREGIDVRIRLNDDGSITIHDPRLPQSVSGTMTLDGRSLVISADGAPQNYVITLPQLIEGLAYESVSVTEAGVALSFTLAEGVLQAP